MQPVEQILAEAALLHIGDQIAIGGGDDAHIDLDRLRAADRFDFAFLNGAQELHLRRRAAIRRLRRGKACPGWASTNLPVCRSVAPVNEPFSWPNRIDSIRFSGMRAAIDRDEGLAPPARPSHGWRAPPIPCRRRIPRDQHRNGRGGRLLGDAQQALHARAFGDDVGEAERAGAAVSDAR